MVIAFLLFITVSYSLNQELMNITRINMYDFLTKYHLIEPQDNDVFSTYSMYLAFSLLYPGAKGNTKKQFEEVFGSDTIETKYEDVINYLSESTEEKNIFTLENTLWIDKNLNVKDNYIDVLKSINSFIHSVKFSEQPEVERIRINDYVETVTHGLIKDLIPSGFISSLTRLVITNAMYFKNQWKEKFELMPNGIHFKDIGEVKSMKVLNEMNFLHTNNYTSISIPYENDYYMTIIMPDDMKLFEQSNLFSEIGNIVYSTLNTISNDVLLKMPLFKLDKISELKKRVISIGLVDAFDDNVANFDGISYDHLFISEAFHKAFIDVNEHGTEAAAATALLLSRKMAFIPPVKNPINITIDKPFFSIITRKNALPLFFSKVTNPYY
ncbi:Serine protease inhibitor [Entamoeba marina]